MLTKMAANWMVCNGMLDLVNRGQDKSILGPYAGSSWLQHVLTADGQLMLSSLANLLCTGFWKSATFSKSCPTGLAGHTP